MISTFALFLPLLPKFNSLKEDWAQSYASRRSKRTLYFCDNLHGQKADAFKKPAEELVEIVWYEVANASEIWQPIIAGYVQLSKVLIRQESLNWLDDDVDDDDDDYVDKSLEEVAFTASEKFISNSAVQNIAIFVINFFIKLEH